MRLEELETRLTPAPVISTIAGTGGSGYGGDGGPATSATLYLPYGDAVDGSGNVFIADTFNHRIREVVKATGAITTVAGTGSPSYNGDGGPATSANIGYPHGVAVDASGNLYIADSNNQRVREVVKATGAMITIAGTGGSGYGGDGGPATAAQLNNPFAVAVDGSGNVFFSDQGNNRVREVVKATGAILTVAGTGTAGFGGDNGPATAAMLHQPNDLAVDAAGNLFIADSANNRVREVVKATGAILTVAGTGTAGFGGDNGPATSATLSYPGGVAVDGSGNLFIGDTSNNRVREVTKTTGVITTVAGTGTAGFSGDGGLPTSAALYAPYGVAVGGGDNVFITDSDNYRIREVTGLNSPVIGGLSAPAWTVNQPGFSGSLAVTGGTAPYGNLTATGLPPGVTAALSGSTITLGGTPTAAGTYGHATVSVQDAAGLAGSLTFSLTVNPAPTFGSLTIPQWTAEVSGYNGYIPINGGTGPFTLVGQSNPPPGMSAVMGGNAVSFTGIPTTPGTYNVQLTVQDATGARGSGTVTLAINAPAPGSILVTAGTGFHGYGGDGGAANLAYLYGPEGVAVDGSGNVFIADYFNHRVREVVKATGNILTVAGTGTAGYGGDGGPATAAQLDYPSGVAVDGSGNLFIADSFNHRIREVVQATGNIVTVAGNGATTDSGDGGPANTAGLASVQSLAVDAAGNLFLADPSGNRVREVVQATGNIVTVAGTGTAGYGGDGGPATAAPLDAPAGVAVDAGGNVFVADSYNHRVREVVAATGNIVTVAGTGTSGYGGDGGLATAARLYDPQGVAVDSLGDVLIADTNNNRVREVVQSSGAIVTIAGAGSPGYGGDGGPATAAALDAPYGMAVDGGGNLFIADTFNHEVREVLANPSPVLGPLSATAWTVNQPGFSAMIPVVPPTAPGGVTTCAGSCGYEVSATGLPPGVSAVLNGSVITVSGTPTAAGTFGNVTVSLLDGGGNTVAGRTYSMTVNPALALGNLGWMTTWTVGRSGYAGGIQVSGGTGPLKLSSQANLPPGLTAVLSAGWITFTGTPTTVGTYGNVQLTVTDSTGASITGTYTITINPLPTFSAPSATVWEANQPGFSSTITILGGTAPFGNVSYSGLPPGLYVSQNGLTQRGNVLTIAGTPTTPGTYSNIHVTVQDYTLYTFTGTFSLTIAAPGPAATFRVTNYPTALTAGSSGSFTVAAVDSLGFVATGYRGTVSVGSSDPLTGAATTYTFTAADNGVHTFNFTLDTAGSQQLYARDANGVNGSSGPITVSPAALAHFAVAAPPYPSSYYAFNVTVSAEDAYNNTIPGYTGTVHFTSSDGAATLPADYTFTAGDQGSHTFTATLQTTGTQTVAVNDSSNPAVTGTASVQDVDYIPGLHFVVSPSVTTTTAGTAFDVTLTALDQSNTVAVHYDGTVNFSSTDHGLGVVLPAGYTFTAADAGVHTFAGAVTLVTAGNQSLTAVDPSYVVTAGPAGSSATVAVTPAPVSSLAISGLPATVTRGATQTFTVSGTDAYGNTATGYSGTVHFTSSDPQAVLPPDTTLTGGTGTFQVVFAGLGTQSLSVADTSNGALAATQAGITVNAAPAVRLAVTGFPSTSAGVSGTFSVTAIDAYGYVASGDNGTVHFTSSDPLAVLPPDVALTSGTGSFSATLKTAGTQSLTATDAANGSVSGTEGGIAVTPAAASTLILAGLPTGVTAGVSGTVTVTARDAYGNVATGYSGTVHFTSSDPQAALPADYTFAAADQGVHTFTATLRTAGSQGLAVADTAGGVASGTEGGITVSAAAAASLVGTAPAGTTAGSVFALTVRALDPFGNQAPGYTGTVHFTSTDPHAALPANYTFTAADGGSHVFVVTLTTAGNQAVAVGDPGSAGVSGTQVNVSVAAAAATSLVVSGAPTVTAGVALAVTVTATDAYGNVATGYTGTVRFGSSDFHAVQPADYTFTAADAGTHSFSVVFKTAGSQDVLVQDTATPNISGTYWTTVTPAAASGLQPYYPSATTAGTAQNLMIFVIDPYGNVVPSYTGTVHVTSSDAQAILPADYTFTAADAGVHTLSVTLRTAGLQGVTVQDGANGFTTTVSGIAVTAAAASRFTLGGFPSSTTAGASGSLTVTAYDAYGNVATGYAGTVHFTSSDAQAGLPADYTFTASDQGTHTFSASLRTAGTQSLSVTDTANAGLSAGQAGITVVAGAASKFLVSGYPATTAGTSHSFTVTVTDAYGNRVTGYRGTVRFSSSDGQAALPASYTFTAADNGMHTFSATLKTAGSQSLTVTDTANSSVTGSQTGIAVTAAAATHLVISAPTGVTHGVAFTVTVTALDAYGNVATGYLGTIHFTSSDRKGSLPSDYTFVAGDAGVHTFTVTFNSTGTQTLTATDTHTGTIKGSASVKVS